MSEAEIKDLSFEAALGELEKIVSDLEKGDVSLDKSVEIYERGESLKKHCAKLLKSVEDKVEKIRVGADGTAKSTEKIEDV